MIVCPGCGGRNEPDADTCTFCQRRQATAGRGVTSGVRAATVRKVVLAVLALVLLGVLLVVRSSAFGGAG
jgi:hypothetical protein